MMTFRAITLAALLLALAGPVSESQAQSCLSARDPQARALVEQGQVAQFGDALARAGISSNDVAGVQLCGSGGGYFYRVQLRQGGTQNIPAS